MLLHATILAILYYCIKEMATVTDSELLYRIKANPSAFEELFSLYYKPIFGYIFRRTANFDDAADIAADTFLRAFLHINKFEYRGIAIKVWLYRIATNEVNLYFRNQQKHNSIFEKASFESIEQFQHYKFQDKLEMEAELSRHQQFADILTQLKALPVKYQEVISLRYFEGKDNKEISEILGRNEGTIKSLLSRGLEKLRKKCNQF